MLGGDALKLQKPRYSNDDPSLNRSAVKSIKEKDPKNRDNYYTKYLTMTEISDEQIISDTKDTSLFEDLTAMQKCDAIIILFESNDSEQVDFVK